MRDVVPAVLLIVLTSAAYLLPGLVAWTGGILIISAGFLALLWLEGTSGIPSAVAFGTVGLTVLIAMLSLRARWDRARAVIRSLTRFDETTGLPNRVAFCEMADYEVPRCHRTGMPVSILIVECEIGHTDRNGRSEVLKHLATVLATQKRDSDVLARTGSNQFGVLLPGCGAEDATRRAEHIRSLSERAGAAWPVETTVRVEVIAISTDVRSVTQLLDGLPPEMTLKPDVHRPLG